MTERAAEVVRSLPANLGVALSRRFEELDTVVLTRDLEEHGLSVGEIGAVVHCDGIQDAYEVEFVAVNGETAALLFLDGDALRLLAPGEPLRVWNGRQRVV